MSLLVVSAVENFSQLNYDVLVTKKGERVCSLSSEYYLNLESIVSVMDAILTSVGDINSCFKEASEGAVRESLVSKFRYVLSVFISFTRPDPLCLTKVVEAIVSCCLFLKNNLDNIIGVYNYLLPLVSLSVPGDRDMVMNLKRRAAAALVKIAVGFSSQLMPYFSEISQQIQILLASDSLLGLSEKASLIEFLLIVVQEVGTDDDRTKCYEFVFLPIIQEWSNNAVLGCFFENFEAFVGACGFNIFLADEITNSPSTLKGKLEFSEVSRNSLLYLCNVSFVVLKRLLPPSPLSSLSAFANVSPQTQKASSILLELIVPRVLKIVGYLHSIWNASSWTHVSPEKQLRLNILLELSKEEKRVFLSGSKYARNEEKIAPFEMLETSIRIWLNNIRQCTYSIIGTASQYGVLFHQKLSPSLFLTSLFQDLPALQLRFVKSFLVLVAEPCIINCPESEYSSFLTSWLPQLIFYLGEFLSSQWNSYAKLSTATTMTPSSTTQISLVDEVEGDDASILEVLLTERLLRQASHSFASCLFNIFVPLSERQSLVAKTHSLDDATSLLQFVFQNKVPFSIHTIYL